MNPKRYYDRAVQHISRALQFGTEISELPESLKLLLVKQPLLVTPETIAKLSMVNKEFHGMLKVARHLYHSWKQGNDISDDEVQRALSFSSHLFCYTPDRIQEDVYTVRRVLMVDPHALQRCVNVLDELDVLYNAVEDVEKDAFIIQRFPEVCPNRFFTDYTNFTPPNHQQLHPSTPHNLWGTNIPIHYGERVEFPSLYGDEVLNTYAPVPIWPSFEDWRRTRVQIYHYRPTKYQFFKRKEKMRKQVNKYYMERQIADLDANNQKLTFLHWHTQLKRMQNLEMSIGIYYYLTCYEKEYIFQLTLDPIEHDVNRTAFFEDNDYPQCLKVIIKASLEGEWESEYHKKYTHQQMQQTLQDTAALARVLVGSPQLSYERTAQTIQPTQLRLELTMDGKVYGEIDRAEWFRMAPSNDSL